MEMVNPWNDSDNEAQKHWRAKWNNEHKKCSECVKNFKCNLLDRLYGNCTLRIERDQ